MACPNYWAPYCMAHDYDHVLERRETTTPAAPVFGSTRVDRRHLHAVDGGVAADASMLGFAPGSWPLTVTTTDRDGHDVTFIRGQVYRDRDNDVTHALYQSAAATLTVFND